MYDKRIVCPRAFLISILGSRLNSYCVNFAPVRKRDETRFAAISRIGKLFLFIVVCQSIHLSIRFDSSRMFYDRGVIGNIKMKNTEKECI